MVLVRPKLSRIEQIPIRQMVGRSDPLPLAFGHIHGQIVCRKERQDLHTLRRDSIGSIKIYDVLLAYVGVSYK